MSEGIFVFPGVFSPPTYGHFAIVQEISRIVPHLTIICSTNEEKDKTRWFSEEECAAMWQFYDLPDNVDIITFAESRGKFDFANLVMVRGIRCEDDMEHERHVMKINKEQFGIDKIFYVWAKDEFVSVSATRSRRAVSSLDFQALSQYVAPRIISILLERELRAKNVFMVVGRPGAGKSTFLRVLSSVCDDVAWINTDGISTQTKHKLREYFGADADLVKIMSEKEDEAVSVIADMWFSLLAERLRRTAPNKHIFVEVPYGLKSGKDMYKYLGGKIIYVGCDESQNIERINNRGTAHLAPFIEQIPDRRQSEEICRRERLQLWSVDTDCKLEDLTQRAITFCEKIE